MISSGQIQWITIKERKIALILKMKFEDVHMSLGILIYLFYSHFKSVKAVNKFMDKNGLLSLIRAHEA